MKGILCLIMLLAHAVFAFGYEETGGALWKAVSHAVNLTAFPGFLLCFGFACERAYLKKDRREVAGRLIRRFLIIVAAYYVSALATALLAAKPFTAETLGGILLFSRIDGLSYLLAFALLFLITLLLFKPLDRLLENGWLTAAAIAASLVFAALPAIRLELPRLGMLVKVQDISHYPVLPYFGFFILGAFLSRRRLGFDRRVGLLALIGGLAFAAFVLATRALPQRFPPSLFWVLGGYMCVYALYLLCGLINKPFFDACLAPFGRHTLYYLTLSNVLLALYGFICRRTGFVLPPLWYLCAYILLVLVCYGLWRLYALIRKRPQT